MPGKKDYISIKLSDVKIYEQKRLLLCHLKELYSHFKNSHPRVKVGFSKVCVPETVLWQVKWYTHYMCTHSSPKCGVNIGSLQNI
jgi:hypothetical protein